MHGNSRPVRSTQRDVHLQLRAQVHDRLDTPWLRPVSCHTRQAFESISARAAMHPGPLLIDAGCGTGDSTRRLAEASPGALALGVDKSSARLGAERPEAPDADHGQADGIVLLRADLRDFWRLALAGNWRPTHQYILYPNPWPKPGQLARRWHAHPVFPYIVALGGELELRSNWRVYVDEFARALSMCGVQVEIDPVPAPATGVAAASPFEHKYLASGQTCWRLLAQLGNASLPRGRTELVAAIPSP